MEYYSAIKKNEIKSFTVKMDGVEDCHVEWDKPRSKSQISHFLAYMWNLDLKIMTTTMMMIMMKIMTTTGHKCKRGMVWEISERGRGKGNVLGDEEE
jgi:hypothetical protein